MEKKKKTLGEPRLSWGPDLTVKLKYYMNAWLKRCVFNLVLN